MEDNKNQNKGMESELELMPYADMVELVSGFQAQLQSLDYRVTNKNFGSKLYQSKETIASKSRFITGADEDVAILDAQNAIWRLWIGAKDPLDAAFRVDKDGNMTASSVTLSGYIEVGDALDDIGSGNITSTYLDSDSVTSSKIAANAVTASKINVGDLAAINADLGTVTSGDIRGARFRTSTSGDRVEISDSDDSIKIYDGGDLRIEIFEDRITFIDDADNDVVSLYASPSGNFLLAGHGSADVSISTNADMTLIATDDILITAGDTVTITTTDISDDVYIGLGGNTFMQFGDARVYMDVPFDMEGNDITDGGDFTCVSLTETSDIRRKKNIKPVDYGLSEILKLEPIQYQFKPYQEPTVLRSKESILEKSEQQHLGFSAQDVFKVMPELTKHAELGSEKTARLYTTQIIPVLVRAIQELDKKIEGRTS